MLATKNIFSIVHFTLIFAFCCGCKKKDTNNFPEITFDGNVSGFSCDVPCQFTISGKVTDDNGIEFVSAVVLDKNETPITPLQKKTFNKEKSVNFSFTITEDDEYLATGTYRLKIQASDGELLQSKYLDVYISVLPLEVDNIYIASENAGTTNVYKYSESGNVLVKTLNTDVGALICDSKNQQLIVGGKRSDIVYYDVDFNEHARIASKNTFFPYFHHYSVNSFESFFHFYVSTEEGFITKYSSTGSIWGSYQTDDAGSAMLPYFFQNLHSGYTLVDMQNASVSNEELHVYYTNSGLKITSLLFTGKQLVGVGDFGSSNVKPLLFLNENGVGQVWSLSIEESLMVKLKDVDDEIYDVLQLNTNEYLLATSNGVKKYTYNNSSVVTFNANVCTKLLYEKVDGITLGISGSQLIFMDQYGNTIEISNHPETISAVGVMYSR
ncbi:MAG: hypothetical protein ACLGGV_04230 [Bacteroidia bacterium]